MQTDPFFTHLIHFLVSLAKWINGVAARTSQVNMNIKGFEFLRTVAKRRVAASHPIPTIGHQAASTFTKAS